MKILVSNSFTIRRLQQSGFPIKSDLGRAKIANKTDAGWMSGAPSIVHIAKNEVSYHQMFPGRSIQQIGTLRGVPVYADEDLDFDAVRFVEGGEHWDGTIDELDALLEKLQDFLR